MSKEKINKGGRLREVEGHSAKKTSIGKEWKLEVNG